MNGVVIISKFYFLKFYFLKVSKFNRNGYVKDRDWPVYWSVSHFSELRWSGLINVKCPFFNLRVKLSLTDSLTETDNSVQTGTWSMSHTVCGILYVIQMGWNKIEALTVRISFFRKSILRRAACIICHPNHLFNNTRNRTSLTRSGENKELKLKWVQFEGQMRRLLNRGKNRLVQKSRIF